MIKAHACVLVIAVIIAPTRGSNWVIANGHHRFVAGHHRPYEGQQHVHRPVGDGPGGCHHRPYEGQQHPERGGLWELAFC